MTFNNWAVLSTSAYHVVLLLLNCACAQTLISLFRPFS